VGVPWGKRWGGGGWGDGEDSYEEPGSLCNFPDISEDARNSSDFMICHPEVDQALAHVRLTATNSVLLQLGLGY